jgi:hypothetical protein
MYILMIVGLIISNLSLLHCQIDDALQIVPFDEVQHDRYIYSVLSADWGTESVPGPRLQTKGDAESTLKDMKNDRILVAEINNDHVGFITYYHLDRLLPSYEFGLWRIRITHIDQEYKDKNILLPLFQAAITAIKQEDPEASVWLLSHTLETDEHAVVDSLGFVKQPKLSLRGYYIYVLSTKELS